MAGTGSKKIIPYRGASDASNSGGGTPTLHVYGIGIVGTTTTNLSPVYQYYEHGWSTWIIEASELTTQGALAGDVVAVEVVTSNTGQLLVTMERQKIFMGHIGVNLFPSFGIQEQIQIYYGVTNWTQTFGGTGSGSTLFSIRNSWNQWNFTQNNFAWDGTSNIVIKFENRQYPLYTSLSYDHQFYINTVSNYIGGYNYRYSSYPTSSGNGTNWRPCCKLHIMHP